MKEIDKIRNYFIEEIKQNELISKKHKNCKILNYTKHLLVLAFRATGCASISAFASLVCILVGIVSSATTIKICVIAAGYKYKSITKKEKKKSNKIVLLAKTKLTTVEVFISKVLIDSNISHDEFVKRICTKRI